jgi:hypothetical protein
MADGTQGVSGIGADATRGALWRAAQEAAARETARILREMEVVAGPAKRLVVAGGWTRSDAYRTIKRGVLGPFDVPDVAEAGARGAALFAGLPLGCSGTSRTSRAERYDRLKTPPQGSVFGRSEAVVSEGRLHVCGPAQEGFVPSARRDQWDAERHPGETIRCRQRQSGEAGVGPEGGHRAVAGVSVTDGCNTAGRRADPAVDPGR